MSGNWPMTAPTPPTLIVRLVPGAVRLVATLTAATVGFPELKSKLRFNTELLFKTRLPTGSWLPAPTLAVTAALLMEMELMAGYDTVETGSKTKVPAVTVVAPLRVLPPSRVSVRSAC